jgi:DNA-binding MarR family transcriptional regulator
MTTPCQVGNVLLVAARDVSGRNRTRRTSHEEFALLVADVFELSGLLRRNGEQIARRHGQTQARWQLLSVISEGRWTVPAAARRLGVTRQAVQRVADDLVADRQARYAENPAHQRSPLVEITTAGRRTLDAITQDARVANGRLLAEITRDDLERARQVLAAITVRLRG